MELVRIGDDYYPSEGLFDDGALKVKNAAKFLDVDRTTIYRLMESGRLPYSMSVGGRKIPRRALVIFMEQGMRARRVSA